MSNITHPTLYKRDSKGKIRVWWMERSDNRYRTHAGIKDGEIVISEWTIVQGKNIGRSNETTPNQQAKAEVDSEYKKKLAQGGYHENIAHIDKATYVKPMLAYEWGKTKIKEEDSDNLYSQPKLDGMRCIATSEGLFSRSGKPIVAVPHIWESLQPLFKSNPTLILDGELYNHQLKDQFEEIISICRKTKLKDEDIEKAKLIQYHIYDLPSMPYHNFSERDARLRELVPASHEYLHLLETVKVDDRIVLDDLNQIYLQDGYEGQMIRLDRPYENKRSKNLLKRKEFIDEEFEVIGIEEGSGNWSGRAKRIILKTENGVEFGAGLRGTQEYAEELLEFAHRYIGGQATVRYFRINAETGCPYIPVVHVFHPEGRDD